MSYVNFIPTPKFEDYKEAFKDNYVMERRDDGAGPILQRPSIQNEAPPFEPYVTPILGLVSRGVSR